MVYELETVLEFGKHKGHKISEVDPIYLRWCIGHIPDFKLSDSVVTFINKGKTKTKLNISDDLSLILGKMNHPLTTQLLHDSYIHDNEVKLDLCKTSIDMITMTKNGRESNIRFGKWLQAVLNDSFVFFKTSDIEYCVNLFKSTVDCLNYDLILTDGGDIKDYYDGEYYESGEGSLQNSCMKYKKCRYFLNIYSENNNVKILVMLNKITKKVIGRALIWTNVNIRDNNNLVAENITFMDRIYYTKDHQRELFISYAKQNGMAYKSNQNNDILGEIIFNNKKIREPLIYVKIEQYKFDYYPYLDTLCYVNENGFLSNLPPYYFKNYGIAASEIYGIKSKKGNYIDNNYVKYIESRKTDGSFQIRDQQNYHTTF